MLAIATAFLLAACGGGSGTAGAPEATFYVLDSNPTHNQTGVDRLQIVLVRFTHALDPASIDSSSLVVTASGLGAINGTVSLLEGGSGDTLQWLPGQVMPAITNHTIRLNSSVRSAIGEILGETSGIDFRTTGDSTGLGLPRADQLRLTGPLNVGRRGHRATLLNDGRVLVTGGRSAGTQVTTSAEMFVLSQESFFELPTVMNHPRSRHSATRLPSGKVLLAGGWFETSLGQIVSNATAEIFDPSTGLFTPVGNMTKARADHAAILLPNGTVLVTGGSQITPQGFLDYDDCEVFDPIALTFSPIAGLMSGARSTHEMFHLDGGKIIALGGSETSVAADVYDIATGLFTPTNVPTNERPRFGAAIAQFDSEGVVLAGGDSSGSVVYSYPVTQFMQNTGSGLNRPRSYATATRVAPDQILIAGGIDFANGAFIESSVDVVIEGGLAGARTFATDVRFSTGLAAHAAVTLANGDVLFCGGLNEDGLLPNKTVAYIFEID